MQEWMQQTLAKVSRKSDIAGAISYASGRWRALQRYCDDGLLEIDNNSAERALRAVALGRKNYFFCWVRLRWRTCSRHVQPDRLRQVERPRSGSVSASRAGADRRAPSKPGCRTVAVECGSSSMRRAIADIVSDLWSCDAHCRVMVLVCALVFIPSCNGVRECGACIGSLLTGFNYVGDYPAGTSPLYIRPKQVQPFPKHFELGRVYVFQPTERVETERIAIDVFPSRLRRCSATILYAPHNPGDFAAASLGGPFWGIRFKLGQCIGQLSNRYDPALAAAKIGWPSGSRDDYLLELQPLN
jgi:hypothetical protein